MSIILQEYLYAYLKYLDPMWPTVMIFDVPFEIIGIVDVSVLFVFEFKSDFVLA